MLCSGCPTRVSKETPAALCSALPHTGDRIGSSLRLGSDQSSWLTRAGSKPKFPPECLYVSFRQLRTFRRMSRWARSATSGLSAGLLGETQLTRDLVFGRKRAQFVPGRVLDLDADLATFLLPQIFDLARIKHS